FALPAPDNRVLLTKPITMSIKPLPEPAPDNFSGAVGRYVAEAVVDKTTVAVGEAVTWRVAVGGFGNIDTLPEPTWPEIDGWRTFEEQSTVNTEFTNGVLQGRRVYDRILIPSEAGEFVLPALEYGFFNPESEQYETATTDPITFVVVEGDAVEETGADSAEPLLLNEIAPLHQTPKKLRRPFSLLDKPLFWALWFVPLLALAGDYGLRRREARQANRLIEKQKRNAFRIAQQAIKAARAENINLADKQAERILTTYLSDKFDESFVGLSQTTRAEKLRAHGIRETLIRWVNRLYDQAEGVRYGYAGKEPGKLLAEVEQIIGRFERNQQGGLA
ncbi:MAG TPA: hypothetical protein ENJ56_04095, partial [Anaerolineae bacterium]|nr:hypothetical protein [Anaerolineae bacterium]